MQQLSCSGGVQSEGWSYFSHSPYICLILSFLSVVDFTEFATHLVYVGWVLACLWSAAGGPVR